MRDFLYNIDNKDVNMERYIGLMITRCEPAEPLFSCDQSGVSDLPAAHRTNLIGG
jgi:hypothetical protein